MYNVFHGSFKNNILSDLLWSFLKTYIHNFIDNLQPATIISLFAADF